MGNLAGFPCKQAHEADPHLAHMALLGNAVTKSCSVENDTLKIPNQWNGEISDLQNPCTFTFPEK